MENLLRIVFKHNPSLIKSRGEKKYEKLNRDNGETIGDSSKIIPNIHIKNSIIDTQRKNNYSSSLFQVKIFKYL